MMKVNFDRDYPDIDVSVSSGKKFIGVNFSIIFEHVIEKKIQFVLI